MAIANLSWDKTLNVVSYTIEYKKTIDNKWILYKNNVLNNYIKHYKLSNIHKNGQRSLNKNSIENEKTKKVSIDNSIFQEIEDPVERVKKILARKKEEIILKEFRDPYN